MCISQAELDYGPGKCPGTSDCQGPPNALKRPETLGPTESNVSHTFSNSLSQMEPCHLKYDQDSTIRGSLQEENYLVINDNIIA